MRYRLQKETNPAYSYPFYYVQQETTSVVKKLFRKVVKSEWKTLKTTCSLEEAGIYYDNCIKNRNSILIEILM